MYTLAQAEAIACLDQPLQIIACAGSGKTQVISQRIAAILAQPGVEPRNIIAFTFTEKGAAELKERVLSIVQREIGDVTGLAEMFIGTMHGYCLDLLQRLVPEKFKFSVLTAITAQLFVDRYSAKSGLTSCPTTAKNGKLRRYIDSKLYLQVVSVLREDKIAIRRVPAGVIESFEKYMALLHENSLFDYTEIIRSAVAYLEGDQYEDDDFARVQDHIRDDIRYVVVDEYQAVNPLQERLIRGLVRFGANLCVVGDDDQTIYQWRGSQVSNIVTFASRYASVRQVVLDDNFRSSRGVVELGRSVAERIPAGERLQKAMVTASHQTWERGDLLALTFDGPETEAAWIVDRIEHLRGVPFRDGPKSEPRGLSWSDCAVLVRSVAQDSEPVGAELRRRGIPFIVKGLNRLFDSPEIQAVVGIFRFVAREIEAGHLKALWDEAALIPSGAKWVTALKVLETGRDFAAHKRHSVYNIQRLYLDFLQALDMREDTLPGDATRGGLVFYQLGKFSQVISDYEQIHFTTEQKAKYDGFAKWLEHQAPGYYADADADVGYATPDAVTIATVHQSKGLQWPAVFLPALRKNRFPSRVMGGVTLRHVIPDAAIDDPARYRGTVEDETRLLYVAVTRAQKYLYATFAPVADNQQQRARSAFFDHIAAQQWVSTTSAPIKDDRLTPQPVHETPQVTLSFSELKYLFECSYQFKLRFLYGFNAPIHEALGYGIREVWDVRIKEIEGRFGEKGLTYAEFMERADDRAIRTGFEAAKKAFGADIAQSYVNHLAGPDDEASDDDGLRDAYVRSAALATVKEVRDKVDVEALELTGRLFAEHRVAIKELSDVRQQEYEDIRAMTTDPQRGVLRPPRTRIEGFSVVDEDGQIAAAPLSPLHLMSDEVGQFPLTSLNNWEREVVLAELGRPNVRGWYRNPSRAAVDSLGIA